MIAERIGTPVILLILLGIAHGFVAVRHGVGDIGTFLGHFADEGDVDQIGAASEIDLQMAIHVGQGILQRQSVQSRLVDALGPDFVESEIGDDGRQHVGRLHDIQLGLEGGRVDYSAGLAIRTNRRNGQRMCRANLDLGCCNVGFFQNFVGDVIAAAHRENEDGKDHPEPISDDLKVFVKMKYLIAVIGHT